MLGVGSDDARRTLTIKLDLVGTRQNVERAFDRGSLQVIAQVEQGIDRTAADLVDQIGGQIVLGRWFIGAGQ